MILSTERLFQKLKDAGITVVVDHVPHHAPHHVPHHVPGDAPRLEGNVEQHSGLVMVAKRRLDELACYAQWLASLRPSGLVEYKLPTGIVLLRLHEKSGEQPPLTATHWRNSDRRGAGEWIPIEDGRFIGYGPKRWVSCVWGK